ncbi:MAG TPA: response regulator transcription factor [Bacillales bacterium]|nr:response regulator transcription factor [Bacillales bacterium]
MSLTLNRQMKAVLRNGIWIIRKHQQAILAEWEEMLAHFSRTGKKSVKDLETTVSYFSECLFSDTEDDMKKLFSQMDEKWDQCFSREFQPNHLIFFITLLENAAHEAIRSNVGNSYRQHQAVQYLFSQMSERMLAYPYNEQLDLDTFLEQLVSSQQLPIKWVAKLAHNDDGIEVNKIFGGETQHLLPEAEALQANTLFSLSESLLKKMSPGSEQEQRIYPVPSEDGTLLFCTNQTEPSHILPFVTFALQIFRGSQDALRFFKQEQQWKDAVILFNEWIMRSQSLNEALENVTSGFVNYLPFERCALFAYSTTDQSGFGLFAHQLNKDAIREIKEDVNTIPLIQKNLQQFQQLGGDLKNLQPIYISEAAQGLPDQYVRQFQLESVVIAPIFVPSGSRLIGAAILDQGPGKKFKVSRGTFTALMKFGQSAGEILAKYGGDPSESSPPAQSPHLSPREMDVLKLMAEGASTSEAADSLNLSEYTVRDYISAIMQKMNARNRTEAVVKAIRGGMI